MRTAFVVVLSTIALLVGAAISTESKPTIEDRLLFLERLASHTANESLDTSAKVMSLEQRESMTFTLTQIVHANAEISELRGEVYDLKRRLHFLEKTVDRLGGQ